MSADTCDIFRHQHLPDNDHIRLIEILDINERDVRCRLTCWPIGNAPRYDAISYTWGDPNLVTFITINNRRLEVTQNCEYVLKQARWHGGSQYHWIDAICIDQRNTDEKSEQVARMGGIYKDAQRVLACVGTHDDASRNLFSTIQTDSLLTQLSTEDSDTRQKVYMWLKWKLAHRTSTHRAILKALNTFAQRSYFRRVWILQELFHGREIVLCCGTDHTPFGTLVGLYWWSFYDHTVSGKPNLFEQAARHLWLVRRTILLKTERQFRDLVGIHMMLATPGAPRQKSLREFMGEANHFMCQDPRDKVYGLLSMVYWGKLEPIQPDYSKGVISLYSEVVATIHEELLEWGTGGRPWISLGAPADDALKALGLMDSSPQPLDFTNTAPAGVIEVRRSPWAEEVPRAEPTYTFGQFSSIKVGDRGQIKLCISFSGCRWQLDEPPARLMAASEVSNIEAGTWWRPYRLHIILTNQGEACLVFTRVYMEPGISILKLNGPQFSHDVGPVVMGLVMRRHTDGHSRIIGHALIQEPGDCVLKYQALGLEDPNDGQTTMGTIVTKRECRDGSGHVRSVVLSGVETAPLYGITRPGEAFIKELQGSGTGADIN
ncbi:Heterokaryon incompatibility protein 6 [Cytospora mali]|uniref:Heterokaryon incompatibility protein 6 n=1 Tax=Cytospora mali TaxID=578113 RepID=A0A194VJE1_CYTMA|nr:Heterokaryon incompatibility protein 6 [Valsa mali]